MDLFKPPGLPDHIIGYLNDRNNSHNTIYYIVIIKVTNAPKEQYLHAKKII